MDVKQGREHVAGALPEPRCRAEMRALQSNDAQTARSPR